MRASAKFRSARRVKDAGAVIFIVAMTMAVLGSLGLYALTSASTEVKLSGHERQAAQTQYLAEYGELGATQMVTQNNANYFLAQMRDSARTAASCTALASVPIGMPRDSLACTRIGRNDMVKSWSTSPVPVAELPLKASSLTLVGANTGSLGVTALEGDFFVELSDPSLGPSPPNMQIAGAATPLCFVTFTATAVGIVTSTPYASNLLRLTGAGMEQTRSRITAGPIPCPSGGQ